MSAREPSPRAPGGRDRRRRHQAERASDAADFDAWLADGLAPDDHDRAAGHLLANAWRERRRALDGATGQPSFAPARRRPVWWWASVAVVAIGAITAVSWPAPVVVDEGALAGAYVEAMGALALGAP